ncbi:hypothetical protein [Photobacterium damselae]|uniref:hypothetical protein n=1 Tax=Photobacterium damselae TaxID=38293 RepID=UPI003B6750C0
MLWFLMVTLPLVLLVIHKLFTLVDWYHDVRKLWIIPGLIGGYCLFSLHSVFDRDALPTLILTIYYLVLMFFAVRFTLSEIRQLNQKNV